MIIRQPIPDDMPSLIEMGRAFNEEAGYAELVPFDADSFTLNVATLAQAGLVIVADKGAGPIAMAACRWSCQAKPRSSSASAVSARVRRDVARAST